MRIIFFKLLFLEILFTISSNVIFAQVLTNNSAYTHFNNKTLKLGCSIGIAFPHIPFTYTPNLVGSDPFQIVDFENNGGFAVNLSTRFRISNSIDLRFSPGASFVTNNVTYGYGIQYITEKTSNVSTFFIDLPINMIYKLKPIKDKQFYFGGGVKYQYDLNAKDRMDILEQVYYKTATDFQIEGFLGLQFFTKEFIFSPEIKFSQSIGGRILQYQKLTTVTDTYFKAVPSVVTISLIFEK